MSEGHKEICKVFASGKTCKFDKRCRYLHFRHPSAPDSEERYHNGAVNNQASGNQSYSARYHSPEVFLERKKNEAVNTKEIFTPSKSYLEVPEGYAPRYDKKEQADTGNTSNKGVCRFYLRTGTCRFGRNCRLLHERNGEDRIDLPGTVLQKKEGPTEEVVVCQFYKKGICKFGDHCTKSHANEAIVESAPVDQNKPDKVAHTPQKSTSKRPARKFEHELTINLDCATSDEKRKMRDKEIHQLMKRYPNSDRETSGAVDYMQFIFHPSDPDWPFDVNSVELKVMFPETYPEKPMEITVIDDEVMPKTLRRHIWKCVRDWINARFEKLMSEKKAEIMYKPFHKWLDRNLEDIFTAGLKLYQMELMAKASGIDLAAGSELKEKFMQQATEASDEGSQSEDVEEANENVEGPSDEDEGEHEENTTEEKLKGFTDTTHRGTQVKLHNLQLKESTATLRAKQVYIIVQCGRCKERLELTTPPERLNCIECSKCHSTQYVTFRPTLAHQFANVIGYLDLQECAVFDVVLAECDFVAGCLSCNKDVEFGNVQPGQAKDTWCHSCHAKMRVAVECIKFLQLQPSDLSLDTKGAHLEKSKAVKAVKDPAIVVGKPLPENGVCKHFKKSFRWFRFPCCGKAYPCDLCHEDKESHDMLFANRVICGFCAKEQVFAGDRPCKGCNSLMTRKTSGHWEGGKGCRDKIKMSKGDAKKYSDQSKTISKKAQNSTPTGGKIHKLRHA